MASHPAPVQRITIQACAKVFLLWLAIGLVIGLKPFLDGLESGGEAIVLLTMSLLFGAIGGVVFVALAWVQSRVTLLTLARAALTGLVAAGAFVLVNVAQGALLTDHAPGRSSDAMIALMLLGVGLVAGTISRELLKSRP